MADIKTNPWKVIKGRMRSRRLVTNGDERFVVDTEDAKALAAYLNQVEQTLYYIARTSNQENVIRAARETVVEPWRA